MVKILPYRRPEKNLTVTQLLKYDRDHNTNHLVRTEEGWWTNGYWLFKDRVLPNLEKAMERRGLSDVSPPFQDLWEEVVEDLQQVDEENIHYVLTGVGKTRMVLVRFRVGDRVAFLRKTYVSFVWTQMTAVSWYLGPPMKVMRNQNPVAVESIDGIGRGGDTRELNALVAPVAVAQEHYPEVLA